MIFISIKVNLSPNPKADLFYMIHGDFAGNTLEQIDVITMVISSVHKKVDVIKHAMALVGDDNVMVANVGKLFEHRLVKIAYIYFNLKADRWCDQVIIMGVVSS